MADFEIKRHDTDPVVRGEIKQRVNGALVAVDLTGYTDPRFHMKTLASQGNDTVAPKIDAAAVIEDAVNGVVRYDWVVGDTDTAGSFVGEFQLTSPSGRKRTFPAKRNKRYITIDILADLNNS